MNKFLLSLFIISASARAWAGTPEIEWLSSIHDFGAFHEDEGEVTCVFAGINTGTEPLIVLDARANCGCTHPAYDHNPILPGDTLFVSVGYDPSGRPGRFSKNIRITTNTPSQQSNLTIKGTVIGSANTLDSRYPVTAGNTRLNNDIVTFGTIRHGRMGAGGLHIYNPTDSIIIPAVENMPSYIKGVFSPKAIQPGELGILSLTLYTDRLLTYGVIDDSFTLIPDISHPDVTKNIETVVIVNEDFSKLTEAQRKAAPHATLSETTVDFNRFSRTDKTLSKSITLTNTGQSPLTLRRLYSPGGLITVDCKDTTIKPGGKTSIRITVSPEAIGEGEILDANITIITNDPDNAQQIVRIIGEPVDQSHES